MRNILVKPLTVRESTRSACLLAILLGFLLVCLSACSSGILAGGNWQSSGLENKQIRVLAVDPNNAQNIYAAGDQGAIFVSTDAGQHWLTRNPTAFTQINALAFDDSGKKLYAATDNGIFVSMNAAQQWSAVGTPSTGLPTDSYTALAFDLNDTHAIYAGTAHRGVLVSKDDGKSWSSAGSGVPFHNINNLAFDSDAYQLWAATELGIYRSDDGGTTWRALNSGLPSNIIVYTVQPASINGGTRGLVFAGTNRGFFLSKDAGAHWAESLEALPGVSVYQILVNFQTPTTIYAATNVGALSSNNNGQTWGTLGPGLPKNTTVYALALGATGYSQLFAATGDVYLFPGSSGGLSATKLLPTLLIVLFFYLLYRLVTRSRNRARKMLKPERIIESPTQEPPSLDSLAPYKVVPQNKGQSNNIHPIDHRQGVGSEGEEDSE